MTSSKEINQELPYPRLSRGNLINDFWGLKDEDYRRLHGFKFGEVYSFKKEKAVKRNGQMYLPDFVNSEIIELKLVYVNLMDGVFVFHDESGKIIPVVDFKSLSNCYMDLFSCNRPRKANYVLTLVM